MFLNKRVVLLGLVFTLLLASCSVLESGNVFPVVERAFISSVTIDFSNVFALSPDGETVINASFIETNLETGSQTRRFRDTTGRLYELGGSGGLMGWSIDGRYLAATQVVYAPDSTILDQPVVLIDTETNTAKYYPGVFNGWSAVNSERFLTNNHIPTNVSDGLEVPGWDVSRAIDFRSRSVIKGNGIFLWDVETNLPIVITSLNFYVPGAEDNNTNIVEIVSFDKGRTIRLAIYSEKQLQQTVGAIFDPTGQYVLLTIWERSEIPAEGNDEISGEHVVDSVLILVDWRTGDQVELFRLSSLDDGNVIAQMNGTAWSANGSTIFIARKNAPTVVLKVKYP